MSAKQRARYIDSLKPDARQRYLNKIEVIGGIDPYELRKDQLDPDLKTIPPTNTTDIFNHVVLGKSSYTLEEFKNYRSMEAYRFFLAGFVGDVSSFTPPKSKFTLITAKVKHSQRMNDPPLKPWIILEESGAVKSAHCTCMAGLGETCSHVGATLFWLDYTVQLRGKTTVTGEKAYWKMPSTSKIRYAPVADIDFQSVKSKKRSADAMLKGEAPPVSKFRRSGQPPQGNPQCLSVQTVEDLAEKLVQSGQRPAFAASLGHYTDLFRPPPVQDCCPVSLRSLRDPKTDNLHFADLLRHCKEKVLPLLKVTKEEALFAEAETRGQFKSKLWYLLRAGRVTASKFYDVAHTNLASPSLSLLKTVCYPEESMFTSEQTTWGLVKEVTAREEYLRYIGKEHTNVLCVSSGFFLSPEFPFLGATPDGLVTCSCHEEKGCLEIKCPFKHAKAPSIIEACEDKDFCLQIESGQAVLKRGHKYYAQVQCQLQVTKSHFCDFVLYLPSDMHVERIVPDPQFWERQLPLARHVFETAILPELVGQFFTKQEDPEAVIPTTHEPSASERQPAPSTTPQPDSEDEGQWCYCKENKGGSMVCCDSKNCPIQWYHFPCVGVTATPPGKWFCPDCRKRKAATRGKKK